MNGEYTSINTFNYLLYFSNQSWSVFQVKPLQSRTTIAIEQCAAHDLQQCYLGTFYVSE